jgi:hypothetical protein
VVRDVINIDEEHEGAEDSALRDARVEGLPGRGGAIDKDTLSSAYQE